MYAAVSKWCYRFPARNVRFVGVRGLTNYGLTCCVNTLLQTLSATWELSDLLDKWEWPDHGVRGGDRDNVPYQLQQCLAAMKSSSHQPDPHQDFLRCLDRNCVRLNTQHDADEVFLAIMSFMQKQMDDKALALQIQNLYKICVESQLQCLECNCVQTHRSYLLSLPLHIMEDTNTLDGCIASFFEHHELTGIDCCFCAHCEKKTPSRQAVKLLSLPRVLCVHLKRFRNCRGYTHKLDCTVTFPETFDFFQTFRESFHSDFTQKDCRYTLHAVVVHSGSATFGHYTAYVRHRTDQSWYHANDSCVQQVSWEDVKRTYGGKSRSTAYMLMYRRGSEEGRQQPELSG